MPDLSLHRVWVILKREYAYRVYTRSFVASTILIPLLLVAMIAVPAYLSRPSGSSAPAPRHMAATTAAGALAAVVLLYVLFMSLFTYGVVVMRAVLEEKQSRVLEVLLCFASPDELMIGKILGVGALALTQVLIWITGVLWVISANSLARETIALMHQGPPLLVYFILFDALGYLLYSSIFAAVGAAFNSPDEAQQWMFVLILPLAVAGMLLPAILAHPDSRAAMIASMVPFTAPPLMFTRMLTGHPATWEFVVAIALLIASILAAMWLCARIYRVGILMYGKRPTIGEIARWLRYSS